MRTLLIRFSALGDVAMLAPIVKEAAEAAPDDTFTVLSMPFCAPLFENLADNVYFLGKNIKRDYKGVFGLYRLFRELHALGFDRVVDEHDVLRTKVLRLFFRLHGYPVAKIDKHRALRHQITAPEGKKKLMQLPTSFQNYRAALTGTADSAATFTFGATPNPSLPLEEASLPRGKEEECRAGKPTEGGKLTQAGKPEADASGTMAGKAAGAAVATVGIAPFAAHKGKIYPLDKMERVIELLLDRGCDIILFGGGGKELETMQGWVNRFSQQPDNNPQKTTTDSQGQCNGASKAADGRRGSIDLARTLIAERGGEAGLRSELLLMKDLDVMVSMDSANMHLASLVGCRVVSIWGATHPCAGFLGWGQKTEDCIQHDLPCRPCSIYGNKPCQYGDYRCLKGITPEEVVKPLPPPPSPRKGGGVRM